MHFLYRGDHPQDPGFEALSRRIEARRQRLDAFQQRLARIVPRVLDIAQEKPLDHGHHQTASGDVAGFAVRELQSGGEIRKALVRTARVEPGLASNCQERLLGVAMLLTDLR